MKSKYSISFTAGGLLYDETISLLPLLKKENSLELLSKEIKENKVLMINSESARKRIISEIKKRYSAVDKKIWDSFDKYGMLEQKILLYYVCLKTYKILFEFHFTILIDKWLTGNTDINVETFLNFLEILGSKDETVFSWTDKTIYKGAQVAILMLKNTDFIFKEKLIKPDFDLNILKIIIEIGDDWIIDAVFLDGEERKRLIKEI